MGAAQCEFIQIDYMPQAWAVMTGVASSARARAPRWTRCTNASSRPYGLALLDPPHARYEARYSPMSVVPASLKENRGTFNHPINWAITAECLLGLGDRAWEYYHSFLPSTKNEIPDIHQMEPYIFSSS